MVDCGCTQEGIGPEILLYILMAGVMFWFATRRQSSGAQKSEGEQMEESNTVKSKSGKWLIVVILIAAVIGLLAFKN